MNDDGFLTLEAVVALAISALALGAFYETARVAVQSVSAADSKQELLSFGQSLIERTGVEAKVLPEQRGETSGAIWTLTSTPLVTPGLEQAHVVLLEFEAKSPGGIHILTLRTAKVLTPH